MKVSELNSIIENIVAEEIKRTILEQQEGGKKRFFNIKCDGEPIDTFESEEIANGHLEKYKNENPGKDLIVEPSDYDSHEDMIDQLDQMVDKNETMENKSNEEPCKECGDQSMDEQELDDFEAITNVYWIWNKYSEAAFEEHEPSTFSDEFEYGDNIINNIVQDAIANQDIDEMDEDTLKDEIKQIFGEHILNMFHNNDDFEPDMDADYEERGDDFDMSEQGVDFEKILRGHKTSIHEKDETDTEEDEVCANCDKKPCECDKDIQESKKKRTVRLTETELTKLISEMIKDTKTTNVSVPGLSVTKKAQAGSKKENDTAMSDVDKKLKNYLSFEGNNNPEFPKQTTKGEDPVKFNNTGDQDEEVARNFAGLQNLEYDIEPSEQFKKRLKMAIEGDTLMGNAPITSPASIKPSNGAEKGKESEDKSGNNIPTDTAKKIEKQVKDREKDKKERVLYKKEVVPVNETNVSFSNILSEEIEKMKKIASYNKKTQ